MKKKIVMIWDLNWTFLRAFVAVLCVKMSLGGCKRELLRIQMDGFEAFFRDGRDRKKIDPK